MSIPRKMAPGDRLTAREWNMLLDHVRSITPVAGAGVAISHTLGGARISARGGGGSDDELCPWRVRRHEPEGGAAQWEVYVPAGAMAVGETCRVLNRRADAGTGHGADGADWYLVKLDEAEGEPVEEDGAEVREWRIVAHGKPRAMLEGVDSQEEEARAGVYVAAERVTADDAPGSDQGDAHRITVATVRIATAAATEGEGDAGEGEEGEPATARTVRQIARDPVAVGTLARGAFDLVWWLKVAEDGGAEVARLHCVRQMASIAGGDMQIDAAALTDVRGAKLVYLHIVTQGAANVGEVVADPSDTTATDEQTWALLYTLDGSDRVTADVRAANLANIQYYR